MIPSMFRVAAAAVLIVLMKPEVQADLILGLQTSGSLNVNSGDTVFLDLVLTDTNNSTALQAEGLFAGGGRILKAAGAANVVVGGITDPMSYWVGGSFNTNPASSGAGVELAKVSALLDFAAMAGAGVGNTTIRIAQFAFQITGAGGSTVQLVADRLGLAPFIANTTYGGQDLDDLMTFDSLTFTVNGAPAAVPEPASMILASLTAVVAGGARYARRRRLRRNAEA